MSTGTPDPRAAFAHPPGQAAYEAHAAMVSPRPWRWDQLDGKLRAAWDAAAESAIKAARPPGWVDDIRQERDRWHGMYDQAQAAHNAVAARNAELAAELAAATAALKRARKAHGADSELLHRYLAALQRILATRTADTIARTLAREALDGTP